MYIASCPLRVSLFGGSTDNPYFVEKYGRGSVISFTSNLKTYVAISQDTIGYNNQGKYIINYSRREEVSSINEIENIKNRDINKLKIILANEATAMLHGKTAALNAEKTAKETFIDGIVGKDLPVINLKKKKE